MKRVWGFADGWEVGGMGILGSAVGNSRLIDNSHCITMRSSILIELA